MKCNCHQYQMFAAAQPGRHDQVRGVARCSYRCSRRRNPCQSFSVAGLRGGLDDARGNLMLTYACIARKYRPRLAGLGERPRRPFKQRGRDFGSLLGLLSGRAVIEAPADGWQTAESFRASRADTASHGECLTLSISELAQRRRRVFVVGYLGDWRRAAAVLLERASLRGDPPPSRKARQRVASRHRSRKPSRAARKAPARAVMRAAGKRMMQTSSHSKATPGAISPSI
jgi:hypothetical protein